VGFTFHSSDDLVQRLDSGGRPLLFLVGSALTMPSKPGAPGVAGVAAMVDLIRARFSPDGLSHADAIKARKRLQTFDQAVKSADGGARYQTAFQQLRALGGGADAMNAVIRDAVLRARNPPTSVDVRDTRALAALERSAAGWHLGPGIKALGQLVAHHDDRVARVVLTTNFDPLIEVAIRGAGGQASAVELLGDGALPVADPVVASVVHLHGLWRSDTLHTPGPLTLGRAALRASLARLLGEVTLVVLGYGGWDDVITETLAELGADTTARPDIVWCFYETDPKKIESNYAKQLRLLEPYRERFACFAGVDCNVVLPKLRAAFDGEGELLGREAVCDELQRALDSGHAVEILGEPHMKRSRLLRWLRGNVGTHMQFAVVSARDSGPSAKGLVLRIAEAAGRYAEVDREIHRERSVPTTDDAVRCLDLLRNVWVLLDDAEALARDGHRFTEGFFAELRRRVQAGDIHWISVSRAPLGPLFQHSGLTSQFLNDARKIYAGALDVHIVRSAYEARLGPDRAPAAMALTGTLPRLVYRLCDAEWDDPDQAMRDLPSWAAGIFDLWWDRDPAEQKLLKKIADGDAALSSRERSDAADLCHRGLLVETPAGYALNGKVWEDYVRSRP
jgi:hypothetical protein